MKTVNGLDPVKSAHGTHLDVEPVSKVHPLPSPYFEEGGGGNSNIIRDAETCRKIRIQPQSYGKTWATKTRAAFIETDKISAKRVGKLCWAFYNLR